MYFSSKAIIRDDNKYLLQLRDNKKSIVYPNRWAFFGGRFKKNETAENPQEVAVDTKKTTVKKKALINKKV